MPQSSPKLKKTNGISNQDIMPILTVVFGFVFVLIAFFPGYMTADSLSQLSQARSWNFDDHNPVIISLIWHVLDRWIYPGPALLIMLFGAAFWTALYLILKSSFRSSLKRSVFALCIGLSPPIVIFLGTAWKDVGCSTFLLLAFALFHRTSFTRSFTQFGLGTIFLTVGFLCRHNAITIVFPLCFYAGFVLTQTLADDSCAYNTKISRYLTQAIVRLNHNRFSHKFRIALAPWVAGLLLFCGLIFIQFMIPQIVPITKERLWQEFMLHDLVGISARSGDNCLPDFMKITDPQLNIPRIQKLYSPDAADEMYTRAQPDLKSVGIFRDQIRPYAVFDAWHKAIFKHPVFYLEHRWTIFKHSLGIDKTWIDRPYPSGIDANNFGIQFKSNRLNHWIHGRIDRIQHSLFFRGWFYLLGSVLFLPLFFFSKNPLSPRYFSKYQQHVVIFFQYVYYSNYRFSLRMVGGLGFTHTCHYVVFRASVVRPENRV